MKRTLSEYLFERLCEERGIALGRIPEADSKTPDYEMFPGDSPIIVEVKEIERNAEEIEADRVMAERGWGNVIGHTPGDRIRAKIAAASPQIKARTQGRYPSLLVVFDARGEVPNLESYSIRVAMYGLEQVHTAVPPIGQGSPYATGRSYGPKRKMTPDHNTSISALGAMLMLDRETIVLLVYHNAYARVPLDPAWLSAFGIRQFRLGNAEPGRTAGWVGIAAAMPRS